MEEVNQVDESILGISITFKNPSISMIKVYTPQPGRSVAEKGHFYQTLQGTVDVIKYKEHLIIRGDFNGHIGIQRRYQGILFPSRPLLQPP